MGQSGADKDASAEMHRSQSKTRLNLANSDLTRQISTSSFTPVLSCARTNLYVVSGMSSRECTGWHTLAACIVFLSLPHRALRLSYLASFARLRRDQASIWTRVTVTLSHARVALLCQVTQKGLMLCDLGFSRGALTTRTLSLRQGGHISERRYCPLQHAGD